MTRPLSAALSPRRRRAAGSQYRSSKAPGNILTWKVAFGIVILSFLGSTARADVMNGSFETPVVPVGSFANFASGSTGITGWTVVGPEVSVVNTKNTSLGFSFPAEAGAQWLDLTGDLSNTVEGVQQTIATTPGATYDLSYFVGNVVDPGGPWGTTSTVDAYVNGALIQTATNAGGGSTLTWQQFTTSFVAASSSTQIEFLNGDPPTDNSNGLDNVVVTKATATTPEPATFTLLALALVSAFGFRRFRNALSQHLSGNL